MGVRSEGDWSCEDPGPESPQARLTNPAPAITAATAADAIHGARWLWVVTVADMAVTFLLAG